MTETHHIHTKSFIFFIQFGDTPATNAFRYLVVIVSILVNIAMDGKKYIQTNIDLSSVKS